MLLRKRQRDPATGDIVSRSERLSLMAQASIRRWSVFFLFNILTVVWWFHPAYFGDSSTYVKYQLSYSWGAIAVELLIGIGMFGWARRDSVVLREVRRLLKAAEDRDANSHMLLHSALDELTKIHQLGHAIEDYVEHLQNGQHHEHDVHPTAGGSSSCPLGGLGGSHDPARGEDPVA